MHPMHAYCRYTTARREKRNKNTTYSYFFRTHGLYGPLNTARLFDSIDVLCRGAGNRTRSTRTRSVRTTGILHPDEGHHASNPSKKWQLRIGSHAITMCNIWNPAMALFSAVVTNIFSPALENFATPARGPASLRDIAAPCTKARNLPKGRFLAFVHPSGFEPETFRM
jgi:hypothetical protein